MSSYKRQYLTEELLEKKRGSRFKSNDVL